MIMRKKMLTAFLTVAALNLLANPNAKVLVNYKDELVSGKQKNIRLSAKHNYIRRTQKYYINKPGALLFTNKGCKAKHVGINIAIPRDILEKVKGKPLRFSAKVKKITGNGDFKTKLRTWHRDKKNKWTLKMASPRAWADTKPGAWNRLELNCVIPNDPEINFAGFQTGFWVTPDETVFVLDEPVLELLTGSRATSYSSDMLWYAAENEGKIDIVKDGRPNAAIVTEKNPTKCVAYAVRELNDHLEMCTGARLPVITDDKNFKGPEIHIGKTRLSEQFCITPQSLPPSSWIIRRAGKAIIISGGDKDKGLSPLHKACRPLGTLFAVYEFLERFLGVRWYWPGKIGIVAPKRENLSFTKLNLSGAPSYDIRYFAYCQPVGGNVREVRKWWLRMRRGNPGDGQQKGNHSYEDWPTRFGKTHPEYFAIQKDGKPKTSGKPGGGHVCMSNPKVFEQKLADVLREFKKTNYSKVMPGDANALLYCQCPQCLKKINVTAPRSGRYSNAVWGFANKVAEAVARKVPGKYITCCAYAGYQDPPDFTLMPNIVVTLCLIRKAPPFAVYMPDGKKDYVEIIKRWEKTGAQFLIWDYWDITRRKKNLTFAAPSIFPHAIKEFFLLDCGIARGHHIELPFNRSSDGKRMNQWTDWIYDALNTYVAMRLMWDMSTDVDKLLDEFYVSFYGPDAGPWIKKFYTEMEKAFSDPNTKNGPSFNWGWETVWVKTYPPKFVKRVMGYLRLAVKSARGQEPYATRAQKTLEGFLPFENGSKRFSVKAGAEIKPPKLKIAKIKSAPRIDGRGNDECWNKAAATGFFKENFNVAATRAKTQAWVAYDDNYLYLLIKAFFPKGAPLNISANASRDSNLWLNESCEFFISDGKKRYQFIVSANNALLDSFDQNVKQLAILDERLKWQCEGVKYAAKINQGYWMAELAIPLKEIDFNPANGPWKINFMRNFYYKDGKKGKWNHNITCWSPNYGGFIDMSRYGDLSVVKK